MEGLRTDDPARKAAQVMLSILLRMGKNLHVVDSTLEERLFGIKADRTAYREIIGAWIRQRDKLFPAVYRIAKLFAR